ncbi:site-2 protease family protein [Streptomyces sp. DSM 44917]|uniref:Zinc metalloprotease n=1 Tax=Streptomyces boetiae TaxID=3075541 RepID=A0ABU2L9T0_9ACTN|nr:site-2 protease family protein [Streptomyces sp. DSM 44917]MDT0308327.1 site-2 protease family protein [Streptomyces sp. DSM 44917]
MRASIALGRIAGIRIGVNWSVLLIFGLIALGLAAGRLPEAHPGRGAALYAAAGLATAVVFFASLLAHELAHAVVARRNGVGVDDIVLWLLGGATRMRAEAPSPGAELRIAGAGPLVSLLLGGLFTAAAWAFEAVGGSPLLVEATAWLAAINVLLALFNVVPAAPLDGGRLLRAFLWWRTGDRLRATAGATTAGRAFGWVLVGLGLWGFLFGAALGGLWLALIGWFLVAAATQEGRQARLREALSGVPVRETMTPDPVTVPEERTVAEVLAGPPSGPGGLGGAPEVTRGPGRHASFPVTGRDGVAVGLLPLERALRVPPGDRPGTTVGAVMVPLAEARTAEPDEPLADLVPRLEPGSERRVLVLAGDGRPAGIVAPSDVNRTVREMAAHPAPPQHHGGTPPA